MQPICAACMTVVLVCTLCICFLAAHAGHIRGLLKRLTALLTIETVCCVWLALDMPWTWPQAAIPTKLLGCHYAACPNMHCELPSSGSLAIFAALVETSRGAWCRP